MEHASATIQFRNHLQARKSNPADFLSRHPLKPNSNTRQLERVTESHVNFVTNKAVPKAVTLKLVEEDTISDMILQQVKDAIQHNLWNKLKTVKPIQQ